MSGLVAMALWLLNQEVKSYPDDADLVSRDPGLDAKIRRKATYLSKCPVGEFCNACKSPRLNPAPFRVYGTRAFGYKARRIQSMNHHEQSPFLSSLSKNKPLILPFPSRRAEGAHRTRALGFLSAFVTRFFRLIGL